MSTTARKARKRTANEARALGFSKSTTDALGFYHPQKKPTAVAERLENQPREIFGKGPTAASTRFGLTSAARRRLTAAGLVIDGDTVKQPGWFRRLFGTGSAAA